MSKLFGLLFKKAHVWLVIIVLIVGQAFCELELPGYTADIVNVGIQQSGITSPIPEKIAQSEMEKLLIIVSDRWYEEEILECYSLVDGVYVLTEYGDILEELLLPLAIVYFTDNMTEEMFTGLEQGVDMSELLSGLITEEHVENVRRMIRVGEIDYRDPFVILILQFVKTQIKDLDPAIIYQSALLQARQEHINAGVDVDKMQMEYIYSAGGQMIMYAMFSMFAAVLTTFLAARAAAFFSREARRKTLEKILKFSNREFDDFSVASLITRCTNDVQQVQMILAFGSRMLIYAPIMGLGAFFKVMRQDGSDMGWVIGLAVGAILILVVTLFIVAMPKFNKIQKLIDRLNLISREILTGLPVIRAFSREEAEKQRFDIANMDLTKVNIFINRAMATMFPTMMFIMNGVCVLIIWIGAGQINEAAMRVGDLMAFINYTMQIIMAFLMLSMLSVFLPRAIISYRRIAQVLDKTITVNNPQKPIAIGDSHGSVEFKNVSFRYHNAEENALNNISFVSKAGETTAIIGSTGSGKTTLINLIPRFFDVSEGEVLVNGVNVMNVRMEDLRDRIGYVSQKAVLFSGSIRENILYAFDEAGDDAHIIPSKISQAEEFILEKENGYDEEISQGGTNISGGQKQRLSIARAIAKNPDIYIFDDSFSALDYKTDSALRKALADSVKDKIVLIVAQRISTIMRADRIIVLDEGEIVGVGTHSDLLEACEPYRQIAYSQLSREELEGGAA
ncbi:MAG: ABC transporter ATP-binding protein/permease [Oscillospiraceae bacterium]|nr:ABC transporter ATP-binding protein/permease [Oscillospiraceae bacterium]